MRIQELNSIRYKNIRKPSISFNRNQQIQFFQAGKMSKQFISEIWNFSMMMSNIQRDSIYLISQQCVSINSQVLIKFKQSEDYYQSNMTPPTPNLLPLQSHEILENRHRKLIKLEIQKQKSLVDRKQRNNPEKSEKTESLLPHLDDSNFSECELSKNDGNNSSYDSSVHDMFEEEGQQMIIRDQSSENNRQNYDKYIFNTQNIQQSELVIDFKASRGLAANKNTNQTKISVNLHKSPPAVQPISSSSRANIKKSSFMEYYNSLSKSNNSNHNILEKYIHSKRSQ